MSKLLIYFLFISFASGRSLDSSLQGDPVISGYHVGYYVPLPKKGGGLINADTYYEVYYYKNLMMYKVFFMFDSSVNRQSLLRTERSYYFVFNKDSTYGKGYFNDSYYGNTERRMRVDSIQKYIRYESAVYDRFSIVKPDSSYFETGDFVKVYQIPPSEEFPEKFTYSFHYSKTINPPTESFSKSMDNVENRKLYMVKMFGHGGYWPKEGFTLPARELRLEMKPVNSEEQAEALAYFKRYE